MGDRVSIQFQNGDEISVTLFSHWNGMSLVKDAKKYAKDLVEEREGGYDPLDRLEPRVVMVDFIRYMTYKMDRVTHNFYIGATPKDGDNSDNGNHIIRLNKKKKD